MNLESSFKNNAWHKVLDLLLEHTFFFGGGVLLSASFEAFSSDKIVFSIILHNY